VKSHLETVAEFVLNMDLPVSAVQGKRAKTVQQDVAAAIEENGPYLISLADRVYA
jgi:hypothetical protein